VVLDGPWDQNDAVRSTIEAEVIRLVGDASRITFPADKRLMGDWTADGALRAVDALLADPAVDIVLTAGPLTSANAVRRQTLPKPVISTFVPDPVAQTLPLVTDANQDRVSGVPNLTYIIFSGSPETSFRRFAEVAPFEHLAILVMAELLAAEPTLGTAAPGVDGIRITVVPVADSPEEALADLPADVDAVFVTPLTQLSSAEFDRLVQALVARRLPSFSYWGRSEVARGLLTSIFLDTDLERLGRRVAIDVQRLLDGEDAATFPVEFVRSERLTINMATARAIGAYPSWAVYTEAELLAEHEEGTARRLDLATVAREAEAASLALASAERRIEAGVEDVRRAGSIFRPQVDLSVAGQMIDEDRAEASFGSQPQRALATTASVSQLLFSDAARAGVQVAEHQQAARRGTRDQTRLDAVHQAVVAYLNVLRAGTLERIQRENLITTRSHLETAQARWRLGVARQQEVLRWQSQLAGNRRDVIAANAARNQAEIALNRLLNRPLEEPFEAADANLDDSSLLTSAQQLDPFVNNPFAFDLFRDFMADEALVASPELRQIDAAIAAQRRAQTSARRSLWSPTIGLQLDATTVNTWGTGASVALPPGFPFALNAPNRFNWTLGVRASLPLFAGGARFAEIARTSFEVTRLELERDEAANLVEQRIRSTLHAAGASHAAIQMTADGAEAARQNLQLVMEAYSRGAVSIIDLVDAQNAQLTAELLAANAVHDYLVDLMNAQRALGRFDFFTDAQEHAAFLERLRAFFERAGYPIREPAGGR